MTEGHVIIPYIREFLKSCMTLHCASTILGFGNFLHDFIRFYQILSDWFLILVNLNANCRISYQSEWVYNNPHHNPPGLYSIILTKGLRPDSLNQFLSF